MLRVYFFIFIYLLITNCSIAQEERFYIAGKIWGDYYIQTMPVDAYIKIKGQKKGYLVDFSGVFKIDDLKPGKYNLKFTRIDCFDYDTTIIIKNNSVDSINIILPFWYDKEVFSIESARKEIKKGYPKLFVYTESSYTDKIFSDPFWKKYHLSCNIFEKKEDYISVPLSVLMSYNQETFDYLDKTYGKEWRKEAPVDILGLDEWIKK